ncbi:MAG: head GIN domain-containing protein [Pontixanthobacter sp.]
MMPANTCPTYMRAALTAFLALALAGCGESMRISSENGVPLAQLDFQGTAPTALGVSGPDDVVLTIGDALAIAVEGDPDAVEDLRFERTGDELRIMRKSGMGWDSGTATIRVTMPPPERLTLSGSGSIDAPVLARDAAIASSGSGTVEVADIQTDRLKVDITGSSRISGSGTTYRLAIAVSGSGQANLRNLTAQQATVSSAGSGDVAFASDGRVTASVAGSSDVTVIGDAVCIGNTSGSGSLSCRAASR